VYFDAALYYAMSPEEKRLALGLLKVAAIRNQEFELAASFRSQAKAIKVKARPKAACGA
jgi:protein-arginine kinase activator protein McsA